MTKIKKIIFPLTLASLAWFAHAKDITAEEFAQLSPQEAVKMAHSWHRKGTHSVAITPKGVEAIFDENNEVIIPLEDKFFVSIAPYEKITHPCTYHVPTGCTGEMIGKVMKLTIKDVQTGEILKDETVSMQHDGFYDLWLPKDKKFLVTFEYQGKKASQTVETKKDSLTCITTMQLM